MYSRSTTLVTLNHLIGCTNSYKPVKVSNTWFSNKNAAHRVHLTIKDLSSSMEIDVSVLYRVIYHRPIGSRRKALLVRTSTTVQSPYQIVDAPTVRTPFLTGYQVHMNTAHVLKALDRAKTLRRWLR